MSAPASLQQRLDLTLFQVEVAPYSSLNLTNIILPHWIVSVVRQGKVETTTRGKHALADVGCAMVHPPHVPFSEFADGPGVHEYFVFEMQVPPGIDLLRLHPVSPVVRLRSPSNYSTEFARLLSAWFEPPSPVRDLRTFTLTMTLITLILESWADSGSPPRPAALHTPEDRFIDVISFMAAHLDRKLTREELAEKVSLHPGYFDRVFRSACGVAPMQMLRDLRLHRAAQLLESTEQTLETIAESCGLGDAAAFSRTFTGRYQIAPGRYRLRSKLAQQSYLFPEQSSQNIQK